MNGWQAGKGGAHQPPRMGLDLPEPMFNRVEANVLALFS